MTKTRRAGFRKKRSRGGRKTITRKGGRKTIKRKRRSRVTKGGRPLKVVGWRPLVNGFTNLLTYPSTRKVINFV